MKKRSLHNLHCPLVKKVVPEQVPPPPGEPLSAVSNQPPAGEGSKENNAVIPLLSVDRSHEPATIGEPPTILPENTPTQSAEMQASPKQEDHDMGEVAEALMLGEQAESSSPQGGSVRVECKDDHSATHGTISAAPPEAEHVEPDNVLSPSEGVKKATQLDNRRTSQNELLSEGLTAEQYSDGTPQEEPRCSNPVMATPRAKEDSGNLIMATLCANEDSGNPVRATPCANENSGNPVMATPRVKEESGNPAVAKQDLACKMEGYVTPKMTRPPKIEDVKKADNFEPKKVEKKAPGKKRCVVAKKNKCTKKPKLKKDPVHELYDSVEVEEVAFSTRSRYFEKLENNILQEAWKTGAVQVYAANTPLCEGCPAFSVVEVHPNSKWLEVVLWKTSSCRVKGVKNEEAMKVLNSRLFARLCSVSKERTSHIRIGAVMGKRFFGDMWLYRGDSLVYDHDPFFSRRTCFWNVSSMSTVGVWSPSLAVVRTASLLLKGSCQCAVVKNVAALSGGQKTEAASIAPIPDGDKLLTLCAVVEDSVAGVAVGSYAVDGVFTLEGVTVKDIYRRQGLGRLLVACLTSHLQTGTASCVTRTDVKGSGFLLALGWAQDGEVLKRTVVVPEHPPLHVIRVETTKKTRAVDMPSRKRKLQEAPQCAKKARLKQTETANTQPVKVKGGAKKRKANEIAAKTKEARKPKKQKCSKAKETKVRETKNDKPARKPKEKQPKAKVRAPREKKEKKPTKPVETEPHKCKADPAAKRELGGMLTTMVRETCQDESVTGEMKGTVFKPCTEVFPFIHAGVQYLNTAKGKSDWDQHKQSVSHVKGECVAQETDVTDQVLATLTGVVAKMNKSACKADILLSVACCLLVNQLSDEEKHKESSKWQTLQASCREGIETLTAEHHHFALLHNASCLVAGTLVDCLVACEKEESSDSYFQLASQLDEALTALDLPTVRDWVWTVVTEIDE